MIDAKRWGILFLLVLACAGIAAWFVLGRTPETPTGPQPDAATPVSQEPVRPPDLGAAEPEIRSASVAPATAPVATGLAIQGRTVDSAGQPVPDAVVALYEVNVGPKQTFSNAAGFFMVDQLAPAEYRVSAQKEHYNDAVVEKVRPGQGELVLTLTKPSRVSGRVSDEADNPIPDFEVVYLKTPPTEEALWKEMVRSQRTAWLVYSDPEGRFELSDVASGAPFGVGARAEGFEPGFVTLPAADPGAAAQPAQIRLKPEARVAGTVLTPERQPVASATIHLGKDIEGPIIAETDVDGHFELAGLGETAFEVTANHDEYLPATVRVVPERSKTASVEIVMGLGGNVEGTVTKGDAPAAGQTVVVSRLTPPRIRKQAITGPDGHYSVAGIGTGLVDVLAKYREADTEGTPLRLHRQAEIEPGQLTVVDFKFSESYATVEGTVLANGQPLDKVDIKCTVNNDDGQSFFNTSAAPDGTYRLKNVMPGNAWIEFTGVSGEAELRKNVNVEIPQEGTVHQDVNFDTAAGISGTVVNLRPGESGQVMAFVSDVQLDTSSIEALLDLERASTGQCDIDETGAFRIGGLEPGTYTMLALVFVPEAEGDAALNSLRIGRQVVTLSNAGEVQTTISLGP